jgi:catechol 2,3-dioxygenase-like lactoylglutathione lyase family enzyme
MTCLRHVALRCRDMETSRRFYERLGLRFMGYRPAGNALDLADGTVNMTLIQYEGDERSALEEGGEYIHFGFIVADARETFQTLQQAGATFLRDNVKTRDPIRPGEVPPGSFKVEDPDGNVVDITGNPEEWRGAAP